MTKKNNSAPMGIGFRTPAMAMLPVSAGKKTRKFCYRSATLCAYEFFGEWDRKAFVRDRQKQFRLCDLYEPAAHILADVLGLDMVDAKGLILGHQTWAQYQNGNACKPPTYRMLRKMLKERKRDGEPKSA